MSAIVADETAAAVQAESGKAILLDVSLSPTMEQISAVRRFLEEYCQPVIGDCELVSRMVIAAHELLENAAKYSQDAPVRVQVLVKPHPEGQSLSVRVWNIPAAEHLDALMANVRAIAEAEDPALKYRALMVASTLLTCGSGLGLARIRAEEEMALSVTREDRFAVVEATARTSPVPPPARKPSS